MFPRLYAATSFMETAPSASLSRTMGRREPMSCRPAMNSGGALTASTAWIAKTGEKSAMEESMLDFAEGVEDNSRLSCQIKVTDELDGLIVRMPESQH